MAVNPVNTNQLNNLDLSQTNQTSTQENKVTANNEVNTTVNDSRIGNNAFQANLTRANLNEAISQPVRIAGVSNNNQGEVRIEGVGENQQNKGGKGGWNDTKYHFNDIRTPFGDIERPIYKDPKMNTIGHIGCTMTALTNILTYTSHSPVSPLDANAMNSTYNRAMANTTLIDLSGKRSNGDISPFNPPITRGTKEGNDLESKIKESIRKKRPVLIGIRGGKSKNGKPYPRHSITAAGINADGQIMVIDPWRKDPKTGGALYTTLDEAMTNHGKATGFDIAMSAKKKNAHSREG
jgi:hypothetical protein